VDGSVKRWSRTKRGTRGGMLESVSVKKERAAAVECICGDGRVCSMNLGGCAVECSHDGGRTYSSPSKDQSCSAGILRFEHFLAKPRNRAATRHLGAPPNFSAIKRPTLSLCQPYLVSGPWESGTSDRRVTQSRGHLKSQIGVYCIGQAEPLANFSDERRSYDTSRALIANLLEGAISAKKT
jgi:hypothetical protein